MVLISACLCVLFLVTPLLARPDFESKIPNGHKVSHPCFPNTIWKGVGHKYHGGGGFLNAFGEDFRDNGFEWDACICEYDSDGDGLTNGQELGDPNCVWSEGDLPEYVDDTSHPGICQPMDSEACQTFNDWNVCEPMEFYCDGMDDDVTEVMELRFDKTIIPSDKDPYYCKIVKFDANVDLHAFAMEPYLDNIELVHHIDMYECLDPDSVDDTIPAQSCGAMGDGCSGNMLAAWAVGISGLCMNPNVGIRIGKHGAKAASLRIHYHNPNYRVNETDTSGLKFYVTPTIRDNDAMVLNLGQMYLEIPPGQVEYQETIMFTELCSQYLDDDLYFAFGAMHMHYLGIGGYTELWRNGIKVQDIMVQDFYDYNAPHIQNFDPPIHVKKGDTIKHVCRFQSRERTTVTWRGQSAIEEMCHVYFVHYPAQNISHVFNGGVREPCSFTDGSGISNWDALCDKNEFDQIWNSYMRNELTAVCDTSATACVPECKEKLDWAFANHSCLAEDKRTAMFHSNGELRAMQSLCRDYPPIVPVAATTAQPAGECVLRSTSGADSLHYRTFIHLFTISIITTIFL